MTQHYIKLADVHTRYLMKQRRFFNQCSCGPEYNCLGPNVAEVARIKAAVRWYAYNHDDADNYTGFYASLDEVEAELATREHVPNKQEAKAIRQQCARRGRKR